MEENTVMNEELELMETNNNDLTIVDLDSEEEGLSTGTKLLVGVGVGLAILGAKTAFDKGKQGLAWCKNKFGKKKDAEFEDDFDDFVEEETEIKAEQQPDKESKKNKK